MTMKLLPFEIGTTFGDWTVIAQLEFADPPRVGYSRVRCVCGVEKDMINNRLRSGHSLGCGCIRGDKLGQCSSTHGKSLTPNYKLWQTVKQRLQYDRRYENVHLHEPWQHDFAAFDAFIESLGPKPTPQHTLDRIEGTKGYEPGNLRWADKALQSQNRKNVIGRNLVTNSKVSVGQKFGRLTVIELVVKVAGGRDWYGASVRCDCGTIFSTQQKHLLRGRTTSCGCRRAENMLAGPRALEKPITVNGVTLSRAGWARRSGISAEVIWARINKLGWDPARAVTERLAEVKSVTIDGVTKSLAECAMANGITYAVAFDRIHDLGWDPVRAVTEPVRALSHITIGDETMSLANWCRVKGRLYETVYARISAGMDPVEALMTDRVVPTLTATFDGVTKSLRVWCDERGLRYHTVHKRIVGGMSPEEALSIDRVTPPLMVTLDGETKPLREWCEIRGLKYATGYRRIVQLKMDPAEAFSLAVRPMSRHRSPTRRVQPPRRESIPQVPDLEVPAVTRGPSAPESP